MTFNFPDEAFTKGEPILFKKPEGDVLEYQFAQYAGSRGSFNSQFQMEFPFASPYRPHTLVADIFVSFGHCPIILEEHWTKNARAKKYFNFITIGFDEKINFPCSSNPALTF
jgi:hypothetical protein